jgi:hypothetical protein
MQALWDKYPELPYQAAVPWPVVYSPETHNQDWVESVALIENWLEDRIGHHWVCWTWTCWSLVEKVNYCGVSFKYDRDRTLFLLQWSNT